MIEQNIANINNLIAKHITNLTSNNLLSWEDKVNIAEIILHLSNSLAALKYALSEEDGEGWREQ